MFKPTVKFPIGKARENPTQRILFGIPTATILASLMFLLGAQPAISQQQDDNQPVPKSVKSAFRPAYTATPTVNRIEARRGQTVPFKFTIEPLLDNVKASLRPVALKQDLNGAIMADLESPPPEALRISGKSDIQLSNGESTLIEGSIRVPTNQSPFHSFGILIRDEPRAALDEKVDGSRYGVDFVTQYILRCDVDVSNGRIDGAKQLLLESVEFVEFNGLPVARVVVANPTEMAVEFEMDCRFKTSKAGRGARFVKLVVPVQAGLNEPAKWQTRVLPNSRIEMMAPWPKSVFTGDKELEVRLRVKGRTLKTEVAKLRIERGQFPAQETFVIELAPRVTASPSQLALGAVKPLSRYSKMSIRNDSDQVVLAKLSMESTEQAWVSVAPAELQIQPGTKRNVVVKLVTLKNPELNRLSQLLIQTSNSDGQEIGSQKLPVAFFGSGKSELKLQVADPIVVATDSSQSIVNVPMRKIGLKTNQTPKPNSGRLSSVLTIGLPVTNQSDFPVPLNLLLETRDFANNPIQRKSGFGKWILPGESRTLKFKLSQHSFPGGVVDGKIDFFGADSQLLISKKVTLQINE